MTAMGIVVAIGHTAATADQIRAAIAAGARMSTHLGNGAHAVLRRHPNYIWEQLAADELWASFIADGIHVPPHALKVMLRAKGPGRSVLVTDATAAAAAPPGLYRFAGMAIEHCADGSACAFRPSDGRGDARGKEQLAGCRCIDKLQMMRDPAACTCGRMFVYAVERRPVVATL